MSLTESKRHQLVARPNIARGPNLLDLRESITYKEERRDFFDYCYVLVIP